MTFRAIVQGRVASFESGCSLCLYAFGRWLVEHAAAGWRQP